MRTPIADEYCQLSFRFTVNLLTGSIEPAEIPKRKLTQPRIGLPGEMGMWPTELVMAGAFRALACLIPDNGG